MIKSDDISVVVQGPIITGTTSQCLTSIRKNLPNAEIILSTWVGSDVSGLDYDILILNKDPGFVMQGLNGWTNICNINRMLKSTREGLKRCSRQYILKIRTDFFIKKARFLKYFDRFPFATNKYRVFNHKVIAYPIFSLRYENKHGKSMPELFHVSDTTFFGLATDIRELLMCKIVIEPSFSRYFENHKKDLSKDIYPDRSWQMAPEQYIISTLVKKHFPTVKFRHYLDYNDYLFNLSHDFIMANFIFLDADRWGIYTLQKNLLLNYRHLPKETKKTMYDYKNFRKYYINVIKSSNHSLLYKLVHICWLW